MPALKISIVSLALLLGAWGCGDGNKGTAAPAKKLEFQVRTVKVTTQRVHYMIDTTGTLVAQDVYRLDAQVPGTVEGVTFNEGDEVTPNTVLCRLSGSMYDLSEKQAEADFKKAEADIVDMQRKTRNDIGRAKVGLTQAEADLARRVPAFKEGAITEQEVKDYEAKRDMAAVQIKDMEEAEKTSVEAMQAEAAMKKRAWDVAKDNKERSYVKSPIAGVIEQRMVTNGMCASAAGTPIAMLVDKRALKLKFVLPEAESAHVTDKSHLTFRVPAYPTREFNAKIYRIGDLSDDRARVVTCWAVVEPTDAKLKSGFFANLRITTEDKANGIVIPMIATLPTEKGFVAFVIEDGKAVRRPLKLGLSVSERDVEVLSGLKEGDAIVVEGANSLQDGVPIKDMGPGLYTNAQPEPAKSEGAPAKSEPEKKAEKAP